MGHAKAKIRLSNARKPEVRAVEVEALADTGASFFCIPQELATELELEEDTAPREVVTADGSRRTCPYVGPLRIEFENRSCFAGALVLGPKVLLGVVQMEDMDLIIHPLRTKVIANPESPTLVSGQA